MSFFELFKKEKKDPCAKEIEELNKKIAYRNYMLDLIKDALATELKELFLGLKAIGLEDEKKIEKELNSIILLISKVKNPKDITKLSERIQKFILHIQEGLKEAYRKKESELKEIIPALAEQIKRFLEEEKVFDERIEKGVSRIREAVLFDDIETLKKEVLAGVQDVIIAIGKRKEVEEETLKKMEEEVKKLSRDIAEVKMEARIDPLTGLYNRRAFDERIKEEVERAKKEKTPLALLMYDIDHFKNINDSFGHSIGDMVLRALSDVVKNSIRKSEFVARYGGEEFSIILPKCKRKEAKDIGKRIRKEVSETNLKYKEKRLDVTISVGISYLKSDDTPESLIERADKALYRAKQEGRNRVFDEDGPVF